MSLIRGDAGKLPLRDGSVHAIVFSPPYNVGVEYSDYHDDIPWTHYQLDMQGAACEMYRVLAFGGRVWVNVMPAVPVEKIAYRHDLADDWKSVMTRAGFLWRDDVIWVQDSHDGACAWGSWLRPSAPNLRGGYEVVQVYFKGSWNRGPSASATDTGPQPRVDLGGDWTDLTRNVWTLRPERRREGAPAPYPIELPARAIRLSTWPGEIVLDPFVGSGTTVEAAEKLGRIGIGVDLGA